MKKLALLLTFGLATVSFAQAQMLSGLRIGVRAGGTLSTIGGKNAAQVKGGVGSNDYKPGFNAGFSFQLPLSSDGVWTLAPELLVNRKGYERQYETTNSTFLTQINTMGPNPGSTLEKYKSEDRRVLTYIDLPIPVRVNTTPGGSGLYFELGPQVGYMARSSRENVQTYKYVGDNVERNRTDGGDAKEDLASFDIGGVAGLGYQTAGGFSLGFRYNQGFKTLFDTKDVSASGEPKAFNRVFMAQVGYLLPLGK